MVKVTSVAVVDDFQLVMSFATGERRRFDMRPSIHLPVFRRLENPGFFALAHVDYGTVVWPGDIDIAPETLYERSVPLNDPISAASRA